MHNFILKCFSFFRSTMQFFKIICMAVILLILLYWTQNLIGTEWGWLKFIKPLLDSLLDISDSIYSGSIMFFGAVFEFKYAIAVTILVILIVIIGMISDFSHEVQRIYHNSRVTIKKTNQNRFNKKLQKNIEKEEKKLHRYYVKLKLRTNKKYAIKEFNVNLEEINQELNQFIINQQGIRPNEYKISTYEDFYTIEYKFEDFDDIDNVLQVLFIAIKAQERVDVAVCIQIEENLDKLDKLIQLNNFRKITMAADTALRYSYVKSPQYSTTMLGLFQCGDDTFEVYEFLKNL